ncbi:cobyric acid synthase [Desulfovibrio sp. OttesenSCG-928-O18]|nr:cobyric acid synthase [Desulfovibrio sp. OttesenSCG-928-O18]
MSAKVIMVQGTASSAGKSALVTGLCRLYSRRGLRVAPFKAQNMALNSFVTLEGGEIGRSQAAQAEACGIAPSVLMNPVLLKPSSDRKSQVIVNGRVLATMDAREYYAFRHTLRPAVYEAFAALAATHDLVVIEGAGSPAEINLRENDLVNMGMAAMGEAPVILVGDIDRGGVFASLYGTVMLLEPEERAHIKGIIVNKFRGDVGILEPGLRRIEALLHIPVLGVLPYWDIRVEEEDSLAERLVQASAGSVDIAVVKLPRLSNFTDFSVFDLLPDIRLRYVKPGDALGVPDMVILPGSKNTIHDMRLLHETGMAEAIAAYHAAGGIVAGVCGGFQMLGKEIADPEGTESDVAHVAGLGLLDVGTVFDPQKRTVQARGSVLPVPGIMRSAAGLAVEGYEIHMGRTTPGPEARPFLSLEAPDGAVSPDGRVFGTYLHGLFDSFPVARALVNALRERRNLPPLPETPDLPATYREYRLAEYDRLADVLEEHLDMRALDAIIEKGMG